MHGFAPRPSQYVMFSLPQLHLLIFIIPCCHYSVNHFIISQSLVYYPYHLCPNSLRDLPYIHLIYFIPLSIGNSSRYCPALNKFKARYVTFMLKRYFRHKKSTTFPQRFISASVLRRALLLCFVFNYPIYVIYESAITS